MIWYYCFAAAILIVQLFTLVQGYRNLLFTLRKYKPKRGPYQPKVAIIAPCKGIDTTFAQNISALFAQDYPDYEIYFVVESESDAAYEALREIITEQQARGSNVTTHLLVAGLARNNAQKVHNQLCAIGALSDDIEALAFVDSDACPKPFFLSAMVHPLRRSDIGASTGYRWYVPADWHPASITLSAVNAFYASLLGPHPWNSCWGGAMAVKRDVFEQAGVERRWQRAFTDDYTLTLAIRELELEVAFVPSCFIASHDKTTWRDLFNFARRQFVITRVAMPSLWRLAVLGVGHGQVGFWLGVTVALIRYGQGHFDAMWAALFPAGILFCFMLKALARQVMIMKILPEHRGRLVVPALLDVLLNPIIHWVSVATLIASGISNRIRWRGVDYVLHALDDVQKIPNGEKTGD